MTQSVEVLDVRLSFGSFVALDGVSFNIDPSEFLCILGPSGCGKTTILNCLAGFLTPDSGKILIGGQEVGGKYERGIVFQDLTQLFPWRTARGNVEFGLEVRKVPREERRKKAEQYLKMVGLEKAADVYPHQLSGGMQQRVAIARALAYDPGVLLMDEPFAALDAMTRDTMQRQLVDIWSETRKTVVYITHNVSEAVFLADKILVMEGQGKIRSILVNTLPRPRDPLSLEFIELQKDVLQLITHAGTKDICDKQSSN